MTGRAAHIPAGRLRATQTPTYTPTHKHTHTHSLIHWPSLAHSQTRTAPAGRTADPPVGPARRLIDARRDRSPFVTQYRSLIAVPGAVGGDPPGDLPRATSAGGRRAPPAGRASFDWGGCGSGSNCGQQAADCVRLEVLMSGRGRRGRPVPSSAVKRD